MADESNQNQTPAPNEPEARTPDGTLKDQNSSTPPSGDQNQNTQSANDDSARSFLNRKPEDKKPEPDPEVKPEDKKPEDKTTDEAAGAPDKYEDFKLPEGFKLAEATGKEVNELFKSLNLPQDSAQKLVDFYAKNFLESQQAPYKLWADTQKSWVDKIESDFGSKAETMRTDINKGIDAVLTSPRLNAAFREALDLTGAGSHPAMFEALSMLVKPFLEGTAVTGGKQSPEANQRPGADTRPSLAEAMYPHLAQNRGGQ